MDVGEAASSDWEGTHVCEVEMGCWRDLVEVEVGDREKNRKTGQRMLAEDNDVAEVLSATHGAKGHTAKKAKKQKK